MNEIYEEYLFSLETIAAEMESEELKYVIKTIESLPEMYKEDVIKCINIAINAGVSSRL